MTQKPAGEKSPFSSGQMRPVSGAPGVFFQPNALNGYQKVVGVCALMMRQIPAEVLLKL
ncbi:hypothetical protein ESA_02081 [Cronobacter sakazakii ATCC BAA-894]|uniref:Uncharacterized protein n=1 Tax=Cronobacter sakazakii (strain ATCC BAA-894) TaxID=290339 RepID=A7MF68_CROS8|nr:hypothetical protein ESA_02081 [Cronobacter sakazakii ATCC BAA-894]